MGSSVGSTARRPALALILLVSTGAWVASCSRCDSPPPTASNLLLITLDTARQDRVGAYDPRRGVTPNIDRLARQGVVFEDARTQVPITLPSHVGLLTGLQVLEHGVRENGATVGDGIATLAEVLGKHGYDTAAFVSAFVLDRRFGLDRGFREYDDEMTHAWKSDVWLGHRVPKFERPADLTTDRALAWLASRGGDRPFFAWVHYFDPHAPYEPPKRWRKRFEHPYDGEMAFMDEQLGRLVAWLDSEEDLRARTLVVVASDHGESLGEHGIEGHGRDLFEPAMRAVWIARLPGVIPAARRVSGCVGLNDVGATALEAMGLGHAVFPGRSRVPSWGSDGTRRGGDDEPFYMETLLPALRFGESALHGLLVGDWKLIHWRRDSRSELFDIREDPGEARDRFADEEARGRALRRTLLGLVDQQAGGAVPAPVELDAEAAAKLRALGYLRGDAGAATPDGGR